MQSKNLRVRHRLLQFLLITLCCVVSNMIFTSISYSQILIKEKLELKDEALQKEINQFDSDEVFHLLRMGGKIKFTFSQAIERDFELNDALSGKSYDLSYIEELNFGEFDQWEEFKFFVRNKVTGEKIYASPNTNNGEARKCNHEIFGTSTNRVNGEENEIIETLDFENGFHIWYTLTIDSSKARIPTAKALECVGDMFSPSESFSLKEKEWGYISIKSQKNSITYSLLVESPYQTILDKNIRADFEGNFRIGPIQVGEEIVISLESDYPILSGRKIYGIITKSGSNIVEFDTWTDLDFDDLDIELHEGIMPRDIHEIKVSPFPFVNRFGDDILIELVGATTVGRDKEFEKDQLFDVWIDEEFQKYGKLSSLDGTQIGNHLTNVMQPILFVGTDIKDLEDVPDFILNLDINAKATLDFPYERIVEGKDDIRLRDELLKIRFDPEIVEPGDTAKVIPYFEYADDSIQEFEPDHEFDIAGIVQGTGEYGVLRDTNGNEDDFISGVKPGFTFIADSSIKEEAHVWIGVATEIELKENISYKSKSFSSPTKQSNQPHVNALTESIDDFIEEISEKSGVDEAIKIKLNEIRDRIINSQTNSAKRKASSSNTRTSYEIGYGRLDIRTKEEQEILLGETKYYAAVKDPDTEEVSIKEVKTDNTGKPETPNNLVANTFSGNPIEVLSGDKSGVYWERKWATIDESGNISSGQLPSGMIRVIGRYWEEDKEYKVKLKTGSETGAELEIKIKKPTKLGDKYGKARDVFDKVVDIDSLIIANAGKYGVLPQLVKGQIEKESAKKEFVGLGLGFAPSYRYEPYYTDPYRNQYFRYWAGDYYFENTASADFSNIPNHQHILFVDYYREVKTVWDIVKESSQLVNESGASTFGERTATETLDFGPYKSIQRKYNKIYKRISSDTTLMLNQSEIADSTNKLMVKYLRDEWQGGMKNHIAQTRVASSYGYLQPMFTTAKEKGYPDDKVPEDINLTKHFFYFVKNQKKMVSDQIGKELEIGNNWPKGYEKTIRDIVYLNWNDMPTYPDDILEFSKKYYPEK